ncbi:MAG: NADH-quinone oxidoreductase subunit N [Verrucomicrobiota bacterium]
MNYLTVFRALGPEVMLLVTAFVALTCDLILQHTREIPQRMRIAGIVTVVGLLGTILVLTQQAPVSLLGGTLVVNTLTVIFKLVVIALTVLTVVISIDYPVGRHVGEYFATLLFGAIGMLLLISAEELITVFVALELTSLSLYILTAFHKGALRSQEAAVKYFMFGAISSAFLLFGMSYLYGVTGTTNLREIAQVIQTVGSTPLLVVALLFILVGFGFKVAVVPFHLWAPDAYEGAPTPVTAFIATGSKVASFFVLTKFVMLSFGGMQGTAFWRHLMPGWTMLLAFMAVASMVLGNCAAIVQHNVKRLLAYSSIAHAGYIFVGLLAASVTGTTAVFFYVIVYALTNLGAFGVVAALSERAGGDNLEHFDGMAKRAPFLSLLMLIFVLSLAGVPPLGGFFGKFYLFMAAVERDSVNFGLLWLVIIGIAMSAVSLYYYLILLKHMYVHPPRNEQRVKTPAYLNVTLAATAAGVIYLGLNPQPLLELLKRLVARL